MFWYLKKDWFVIFIITIIIIIIIIIITLRSKRLCRLLRGRYCILPWRKKKNKRLLAVQPCTYFSLIWLKFTFLEFQWSGKGMTLEKKYKKVASRQILLSNKDTPPSIPARDFNYNTYTRTNLWSTRPKSEFNLSFQWEYFLRQKENWKKNNLSISNQYPHYLPKILFLRIKESN